MANSKNKVIDVHVHVGYSGTVEGAGGRVEDVLKVMDKNGIDYGIISPIPGYPDPKGVVNTREQNDHIARVLRENPTRFLKALGVVEPRHGEATLDEVDRLLGELGLNGLMFHNDYSGVPVDNPIMFKILERASHYDDIVIFVHTFQHGTLEVPFMLGRLARSFPEITFVAGHPMMTFTHLDASIDLAKLYPNIYFDTCICHHHFYPIETAVREMGEERLLFGSDVPYYDFGFDKVTVEKANISDDVQRKIFFENAKRIFKLDI